MIFALLATLCFAGSALAGGRVARRLGSITAFYIRTGFALAALTVYGTVFGHRLQGPGFGAFYLSGAVGFGLGDLALFLAFPRIGSRLSLLLVQCLAAPIAAAAEWLWLGTVPGQLQLLCGAVILVGVGFALAPDPAAEKALAESDPRRFRIGILCGIAAAFGQGIGAVISRQAWGLDAAAGLHLDGGTATFQRMLGGASVVLLALLLSLHRHGGGFVPQRPGAAAWKQAWPWLLGAVCAGPLLGVSCYQTALARAPSAVVLAIVATSPLAIIPLSASIEGDRATRRELIGGAIAVIGVIGLCLNRT